MRKPKPHPSGATAPLIPRDQIPKHVAIVMDGNGRWANQRDLPRTAGHTEGMEAMVDCVRGAAELGIKWLSVFAFSTENWRRSPGEIRFLLDQFEQLYIRHIEELDYFGVRVQWAGRPSRLRKNVIDVIDKFRQRTKDNDRLHLVVGFNYGGRREIADAMAAMGADIASGRLNPRRIQEDTVSRYMYLPEMPDVDLFIRSSGEQRTSNFLPWQSTYAEMLFVDKLWPDFDRRDLWAACEWYTDRDRRFGAAS